MQIILIKLDSNFCLVVYAQCEVKPLMKVKQKCQQAGCVTVVVTQYFRKEGCVKRVT